MLASSSSAALQWRAAAGMCNSIADRLAAMMKDAGLQDIRVTDQSETVRRGERGIERGIALWADVAASRGHQLVSDGFLTEEERAAAEREFRVWGAAEAGSQTMVLLAVEGVQAAG